jgi:ANTAR domain/GAF domain
MADAQHWALDKADFVAHAHDPNTASSNFSLSPLAAEFVALTRALLDACTVADVLEQLVHATQRLVPGADLVSITLRTPDGAFHTPVETAPLATELDQVQYRTGEGPCVEAARASGPGYVRCDDLAHEPAWPTFGPVAAGYGYTSVLSTTLLPDIRLPRLSGALNIYAQRPGALHGQAAETALLLATHASLALASTQAVVLGQLRAAQLHEALASRDVIGQAKGILMHRRGISADQAFDLLRRTSQHMNVKLAELAETLAIRHSELD